MSLYATLADVRAEILAENTVDDARVMTLVRDFSSRVDTLFKAYGNSLFVPTLGPRSVTISGDNVNSALGTLALVSSRGITQLMLSFLSMAIGTQNLAVGTNVAAYPPDSSPFTSVQLQGAQFWSWYTVTCACSSARGPQFATLTGIWGYNVDYPNAWVEATTLAENISATDATFAVTDLAGPNEYGETPVISPGHVIQIGAEWMDVIATDTTVVMSVTTYTITVRRGVNGSIAVTHLTAATISTFRVDESVKRAVVRQCAYQYSRQGAFETARIDGIGVIQYQPDLAGEVSALLSLFANL